MSALDKMTKEEIREFFCKDWMTHDAMWYFHCMTSFGVEKTNILNKAAVKSMAALEIKRLKKIFNYNFDKVSDWEQLKEIIINIFSLIKPNFMNMSFEFPEENLFRGGFDSCFAYDGISKRGLADKYDCGVVTRLEAWWEGLGVKYEMNPSFEGCLINQKNKCLIEFRFKF